MYFDEGLPARVDHAFTMTTTILKPDSRGRVALRSARPDAKPRIYHNYLAAGHDRATLIDSVRLAMDLFAQPNLSKVRRALLGSGIRRGGRHRGVYQAAECARTIIRRLPAPSAAWSTLISGFLGVKDCVWPMRR
jgi:choline dehydrogenase-like flavoprotein